MKPDSSPRPAAWLRMRGMSKSFPGVRALAGVDLEICAGEVHALVGENGAGKSTLIKLLTGVERAGSGTILVDGQERLITGPIEALGLGVAAIYQEVNVIPGLSVAENIFLGRHSRGRFGIDWAALRSGARRALQRIGLDLDLDRAIGEYPLALQQMITIARAIDLDARLLVMDEPTSSLDRSEVRRLFELIERLKSEGLAILFIGHDLDEVFELADRITVLRGGQLIGSFEARELTRLELVTHMLGKSLEEFRPQSTKASAGVQENSVPRLQTHALARRRDLKAIDLGVGAGEVLGLVGLLGSGRTEFLRLIFGADRARSGEVHVDGEVVKRLTPRSAIRAGLALCPENRREAGIFPNLSVLENLVIVAQRSLSPLGLVSRRVHEELAARLVKRLGIRCADLDQPLRLLSGGNQQKVILGRWIASDPRVLLLDEPTRGIDIGAKAEALQLVSELAREGLAVVLVSSTLDEVLSSADRLAVMVGGELRSVIEGPHFDHGQVMAAMAGSVAREN